MNEFAYEQIKWFGSLNSLAVRPKALIEGSDGCLYGIANGGATGAGTVFKLEKNGAGYSVLRSFGPGSGDVALPIAIVEGDDGWLYVGAQRGGTSPYGEELTTVAVVRLRKDGSDFAKLTAFGSELSPCIPGSGSPGKYLTSLVKGPNSVIYGATREGGYDCAGTLFSMCTNWGGFDACPLLDLANDAQTPVRLVVGHDSVIYGVSQRGGTDGWGGVFRVSHDGSGFAVLWSFTEPRFYDPSPLDEFGRAALVESSNRLLYGTTERGGAHDGGTVFRLSEDGSDRQVVKSLGDVGEGWLPTALIEGSDGLLYGTTDVGGLNQWGTVFRLSTNGTGFGSLHSFPANPQDGRRPVALLEGSDGALYGLTSEGGASDQGTVFRLDKTGSGYTNLLSFYTNPTGDGNQPQASVMVGSDGALFGTTRSGGRDLYGAGTVFTSNPDGSAFRLIHSFTHVFSGPNDDGDSPDGGVIEGSDGRLYGTTRLGGASNSGAIFRVNQDGGEFGLVHSFAEQHGPYPGVLEGTDGWLYGPTGYGGASNQGTIFKIRTNGGDYTVLHRFSGEDGAYPLAPLIEGSDQVLYGTTAGGNGTGGTVFKLNKDGSGFAVLHHFTNYNDGGLLRGALLEGSDGALYGTASAFGQLEEPDIGLEAGTVFKLAKDGNDFEVLHTFGPTSDGQQPVGALVEAVDGFLYGTTQGDGTNSVGTVFRLSKDGTGFSVLHRFGEEDDGRSPGAGLALGPDGSLFGTTVEGGQGGLGTVFRVRPTPELHVRLFAGSSGSEVEISWPASAAHWTLLMAYRLGLNVPRWFPAEVSPIITNGQAIVTWSADEARFFQLTYP